jgi:diguanylate cyclase (GGDEF)-like protein
LEALDLVKEAPPHLLVLDALMPQMNGFELLDAIQAIPGCEEIPAVFITALLDPDVEVRALSRGAADFVTKPISSARLSISVRNQLGLKRATDALRVQASLDPLTSIANRRSFDRALTRETERAAATDTSLSLLMVDIDHFKSINDTFGHPAGDLCITGVATALVAEASRKMDLVARYGGEEFAVILPASDSDYAAHVAERIVRRVARSSFEPVGDAGTVTVSVGWASSYPAGDGLSERTALLETADRALFRAKSTGRNRACGLLDLSPPPSRPPRGPNR